MSENYIVGGVPAYSATHIYSFNLDTGSAIPTLLHFGVNDAIFSDNTGAFTIVVTQLAAAVPEPSTWAMMILGFAGVGFMAYRRRKVRCFAWPNPQSLSDLQTDRLRAVLLFRAAR